MEERPRQLLQPLSGFGRIPAALSLMPGLSVQNSEYQTIQCTKYKLDVLLRDLQQTQSKM